jgi:hypothetical protein
MNRPALGGTWPARVREHANRYLFTRVGECPTHAVLPPKAVGNKGPKRCNVILPLRSS